MGYSEFTMDMVRHDFGIMVRDHMLFDPIGDLVPSPWLRETLNKGVDPSLISEKSRGEFIVAPLLIECRELMHNRVNIFSGIRLDVDAENGLSGECDFVIARTPSAMVLQSPLMLILEAKKHDIEEGIGQCVAQLLGACGYNDLDGTPLPFIYGCVTNGESWLFLKLQNKDLQIHPARFAIKEVSKILWFLVECLKDVDQQASHAA